MKDKIIVGKRPKSMMPITIFRLKTEMMNVV